MAVNWNSINSLVPDAGCRLNPKSIEVIHYQEIWKIMIGT